MPWEQIEKTYKKRGWKVSRNEDGSVRFTKELKEGYQVVAVWAVGSFNSLLYKDGEVVDMDFYPYKAAYNVSGFLNVIEGMLRLAGLWSSRGVKSNDVAECMRSMVGHVNVLDTFKKRGWDTCKLSEFPNKR